MSTELRIPDLRSAEAGIAKPRIASDPRADVVLIVEDDPIASELVRDMLEREGAKAQVVGNVEDALRALEAGTFSVVLLDHGLPDGEPWPVVGAASSKIPRVPVVLVTAVGSERIAAEAIQRGVAEYAIKGGPLWEELPACVRRVAERGRFEERQRRNAERFRLIAQHTRDVISTMDMEGRFTYVSPSAREAYGDEPDDLIGRIALDFVHPLDRAHVQVAIAHAASTPGHTARVESRRLLKDGNYIWIEAQGTFALDPVTQKPTELIAVVRDITERRQSSEALLKERAQLNHAQRVARVGSFDWDIVNNQVAVSAELYRILGLDARSPASSYEDLLARVHLEDRERVNAAVVLGLVNHQPWELELRIVRPEGEVRFCHVRGEAMVDETGIPLRMLGTCQDINERKDLDRRLMMADRMVSVGTLAAGVAHEINSPLAYVMANLDLLARGLREPAVNGQVSGGVELQEAVAEARDGAERVRKIVRGLRTFSRAEEERRQVLDLHHVIEVSINLAFNELRHRARLVKDFGKPPAVLADEARLVQVFVNLIMNAAQAIPEGMADRHEIRIVTRADESGRAVIEVHDTGSGIPVHLRDRVFDPFFTTKAIGAATGLGMFICQGIVTGLSGTIGFQCPTDRGTIVTVVLPATRETEVVAAKPASTTVPARRGRVLVVDDEVLLLRVLKRALSADHEVVLLSDAREALALVRGGERFDVIVSDLMMPNMTGMDLYAELQVAAPDQAQRMVFMTGGTFTPRGQSFLDEVPNPRFEKPFDGNTVRALLRGLVR